MQVGVGKPYLYGLCAGGSEGVIKVGQSHFLFILAADFSIYSNVGRLFCTPAPPKFTKKLAVDSFFNFGS